ncbi:MAG: transposase [Oscillospiraceae bacterium]|nr:transposase [Oscillospiraceae bacterium]
MSKSVDVREAAIAYYEEGHTLIEIGKVFKIGKTTVSNWVRKKNR